MVETHTQYSMKVNVWVEIIHNQFIGPYFFDNTVNGERYLDFLINFEIIQYTLMKTVSITRGVLQSCNENI